MHTTSSRSAVPPLWSRFPQFFSYPYKPIPLLIMLGAAALLTLVPVNPLGHVLMITLMSSSPSGLATGLGMVFSGGMYPAVLFLLQLGSVVLAIRYFYAVLEQTSRGALEPPRLNTEVLLQGYEVPFKQLGVYIFMSAVSGGVAIEFGPVPAIMTYLVFTLLMPANTMLLATTHSLRDSISPGMLLGLVIGMGGTYWIVFGLLLLLSGASGTVPALIARAVSPTVLWFVAVYMSLYFSLIMFNMMGYALYQHHEKLGLDVDTAEEDPEDEELELYRIYLDRENYSAAQEELARLIQRRPDDLELAMQLHRLFKLTESFDRMCDHGQKLIGRFIEARRVREALEVYLDCIGVEGEFRPTLAEHHLPLARMLRDRQDHQKAVQLLSGFHQRFPKSMETPGVYLLAAQILDHDLDQRDKAIRVLRFLKARFRNHPLSPRVDHYLSVLQPSGEV